MRAYFNSTEQIVLEMTSKEESIIGRVLIRSAHGDQYWVSLDPIYSNSHLTHITININEKKEG